MKRYAFTAELGTNRWHHERLPWVVAVLLRARFRRWAQKNNEDMTITIDIEQK